MSKIDTIQLNGGSGPPASLADGEFYIDETARLLYVNTLAGIVAIPLAVIALPQLPGDPSKAVLKAGSSATFAKLSGGGGGRPLDAQPWCVPGLVPQAVGAKTVSPGAIYYALFELGTAQTLASLAVNVTQAVGAFTLGVCAWDPVAGQPGAVLALASGSGTGLQTLAAAASLGPGVYAAFFQAASAGQVQMIKGSLRAGRLHANAPAGYVATGTPALGSPAPAWTSFDPAAGYPVALQFG